MCDGTGDIEDITALSQKPVKNSLRFINKCKKCDEKPILLLQKKDPFCKSCFFEYCNHKFRSTIGKTKKVKHGDKVLIACSGGRKSTAMLHMTKQALDSASAKQISFIPGILFIDESALSPYLTEKMPSQNNEILQNLKKYDYTIIVSRLEMVCKVNSNEEFYQTLNSADLADALPSNLEALSWYQECLKDMSLSEKYDLVKHMRLLLMTEIANQLGYNYLFVGDSGNSLAVDLLSDISLGRGSQISSDTNFFDSRFKVPICRPIREFLNKELLFYLHLHNCSYCIVPDLLTKTASTSCVQRLTECFISDLQENFPATVFTIFRTGGKLSIDNSVLASETCIICKSKLDNVNLDPCSAIEALKVSKKVSLPLSKTTKADISSEVITELENMHISNHLCHGCSVPFRNKILKEDYFLFASHSSA